LDPALRLELRGFFHSVPAISRTRTEQGNPQCQVCPAARELGREKEDGTEEYLLLMAAVL
jgi:hypothetical protein